MGRPRKYDYATDYPITLHIRITIELFEKMEELGYTKLQMQKEIEKSQIINEHFMRILEKHSKKG